MALLFLLPRWSRRIPAGLVVLFSAIAVSSALDLSGRYGVAVIGTLPAGLPSLRFDAIPLDAYLGMILPAIGVLLVAFSEALGVAREFADRHGYEVDPDQELTAHAATNLVSALFGGMIAAGGMSGSAVKEGAGAKSQVSNLIAWVATVITLLFLTPLFASLPEAVLAALIIQAVWSIIASRKLKRLRLASRTEFWFALLAMLGVVFIDVLEGMIIGLLSSLLFVVYQTSRPHLAVLGEVPDIPGAYSELALHPENKPVPGVLIVRLDGAIYYANALTVRAQLTALIDQAAPPPTALILDLRVQSGLDLTSVDMLNVLLGGLQRRGLAVRLVDVHVPVIESMRTHGTFDVIPESQVLRNVNEAVKQLETTRPS
jgi:MFS superfamily sulfate permease-like transporter